jgi:hypothetical protein
MVRLSSVGLAAFTLSAATYRVIPSTFRLTILVLAVAWAAAGFGFVDIVAS